MIFNGMRPNILDEPLDRQRILFRVVVSGNAFLSLKYSARCAFAANPDDQQIWYTHLHTKAESTMRNTADSLLAENQEKNGGGEFRVTSVCQNQQYHVEASNHGCHQELRQPRWQRSGVC